MVLFIASVGVLVCTADVIEFLAYVGGCLILCCLRLDWRLRSFVCFALLFDGLCWF